MNLKKLKEGVKKGILAYFFGVLKGGFQLMWFFFRVLRYLWNILLWWNVKTCWGLHSHWVFWVIGCCKMS